MFKKVSVSLFVVFGIYLALVYSYSDNLLISAPVFFYPIFIYSLFWRDEQPNFLFWGLLYQWTSVSIQLFHATFLGLPLDIYMSGTPFPAYLMNEAELLSIIALYFFAFGLLLSTRYLSFKPAISEEILNYSPRKVLFTYFIVSIFINSAEGIIWSFPAFVQYFHFLFFIKWGFFVFTFYIIHKTPNNLRAWLYALMAFEFVLGLVSFFSSSFTTILFYTLISTVLLKPKLSIKSYLILTAMVSVLLHIAILWTASKQEYRKFLNQGNISQSVEVSQSEALSKLETLILNVDAETYNKGIYALVDRIGYIQFFAATLDYVPSRVPHENGKVYWSAVKHYLVPRFLDPNKETLDDSKHTNQYTGLNVSGAESATSFSLGSVADAYIDFGKAFMFLLVMAFGYLCGFFYKVLYNRSQNIVWSWIITAPFFVLINVYQSDTKKALGFILIYFVTVYFLQKQIMKRLDPLMRA